MSTVYDCIVLGLGGFGSSAAYHLTKRGVRVLGLDQFPPVHDRGSSHGETRIIRKAYFEHPDYVPLLMRAYELWQELENESSRKLMELCGLLLSGPADGEAISGARLAAQLHPVSIEDVSPVDAKQRFPGLRFDPGSEVLYEHDGGFLHVEACVQTHLECAEMRGAQLQFEEPVTSWQSEGAQVRVRTARGEYTARRLIVTAGAWAGQLLRELQIGLEIVRKPLFWFPTFDRRYDLTARMPTFYFELAERAYYGFPSIDGQTVKVAEHTGGIPVNDPQLLDRTPDEREIASVSSFVKTAFPGLDVVPSRHSMCMYTLTADRHFLVGRHPEHEHVVLGAGFSGHGFKFTSVIGETLSDLALDGRTDHPIGFLDPQRPAIRSEGRTSGVR